MIIKGGYSSTVIVSQADEEPLSQNQFYVNFS